MLAAISLQPSQPDCAAIRALTLPLPPPASGGPPSGGTKAWRVGGGETVAGRSSPARSRAVAAEVVRRAGAAPMAKSSNVYRPVVVSTTAALSARPLPAGIGPTTQEASRQTGAAGKTV